MVLKIINFYKIEKVELIGKDYEADYKKPKIDWEDKKEKYITDCLCIKWEEYNKGGIL
jgi:hypothetical protein